MDFKNFIDFITEYCFSPVNEIWTRKATAKSYFRLSMALVITVFSVMGWQNMSATSNETASTSEPVTVQQTCMEVNGLEPPSTLNVRLSPSTQATAINGLTEGDVVNVEEQQDDWFKVAFHRPNEEQYKGWVSKNYLKSADCSKVHVVAFVKPEPVEPAPVFVAQNTAPDSDGGSDEEYRPSLIASPDPLAEIANREKRFCLQKKDDQLVAKEQGTEVPKVSGHDSLTCQQYNISLET